MGEVWTTKVIHKSVMKHMFEEPTTKQHLIANRLTPDQISKYINLAFSITIEEQNFTWISFYWKQVI